MDFLDSIDLSTANKKSHRVRSWYLYEQFKSLKRMDAVQKMNDKTHQDRLLRQELSERRARRKLYDQFGVSQSESKLAQSIRSHDTNRSWLSASNDDVVSFCEANEEELMPEKCECDYNYNIEETADSHIQESGNKSIQDDELGDEELRDEELVEEEFREEEVAYKQSFESVIENVDLKTPLNECEGIKAESANNMAENINEQFETLRANFKCLELLATVDDSDKICENESVHVTISPEFSHTLKDHAEAVKEPNNNLVAIWSRLVSFAYQIVQLNHGNCYSDYSSQFLTAVLACDVLRRGVNKMCRMLQPYISPIKLASDESDVSSISYQKQKLKKAAQFRKCCKRHAEKRCRNKRSTKKARTQYSDLKSDLERCWQPLSAHSSYLENYSKKSCGNNEQKNRVTRVYPKEISQGTSTSTVWPHFSKDNLQEDLNGSCSCSCYKKAVNPMLKIARYIDNILMDFEDK